MPDLLEGLTMVLGGCKTQGEAISKQTRCYVTKLNNAEVKEQSQVKISKRFTALDNLDDNVGINKACKYTAENINISVKDSPHYYEFKAVKPWNNREHSKLLDVNKLAKLHWLQNASQIKGDNMDNLRQEASKILKTKRI
jgi:hypothetical protein